MKHFLDDREVPRERVTQLAGNVLWQQLGDRSPMALSYRCHDLSVTEIHLPGNVNCLDQLIGYSGHRGNNDEPSLLRPLIDNACDLSEALRVGHAGAAEFVNNAC